MTVATSPTVERVVRGQLCSGCGLCSAVSGGAIAMDASSGFARPVQSGPISEAAERTIAAACPGSVVAPWTHAPNMHPYWGPWRRAATGYSTSEAVRFHGSSGGAITGLAIHALNTGRVERVVHVSANPEDPLGNLIVVSDNDEDILRGAGSRYAASSPLAGIAQLLDAGRPFAFIGKPCDVSALRQLAKRDPRVDQVMPLAFAFFCAGVPNRRAARKVVEAMGLPPDEVTAFRYRGRGWPGTAAAETRDGRVGEMSYAESWGEYLCKDVQFRCKICPDSVGGSADIACADAWYGDDKGYPSFEERDGRSLILSRTAAGEAFLAEALAAGALAADPLDIGEINKMQPSQAMRKRLIQARVAAVSAVLQPTPKMGGVMVEAAAKRAPAVEKARNFLGTMRRVLLGRR